jgi:hypothetical protein
MADLVGGWNTATNLGIIPVSWEVSGCGDHGSYDSSTGQSNNVNSPSPSPPSSQQTVLPPTAVSFILYPYIAIYFAYFFLMEFLLIILYIGLILSNRYILANMWQRRFFLLRMLMVQHMERPRLLRLLHPNWWNQLWRHMRIFILSTTILLIHSRRLPKLPAQLRWILCNVYRLA